MMIAFVLMGCVQQPEMSREEIIKATTRTYNKTPNEILNASDKILRLADGNDFTIHHTDSTLSATRQWMIYMVLGGATGSDDWLIQTTQNKDGSTKINVEVNTQANNLLGGASLGSYIVRGTALYDLFFTRLEYFLGLNNEWITCQEANRRIKEGLVWGSNEALCNSFNMTDNMPTELKKTVTNK